MFFTYIKDFFNDMRIELKSERTVESYRESLNSFRKYLSEQHSKNVDSITVDFVSDRIIRNYIGWVAEQNSVGTRNIRLAAIKAYVKYAASKNIDLVPLQINIATLKHKTIHPKRNNWLNKEQILLILEQPKPTKTGVRDRFVMLFLFSTGARLNEMIAVKVKDVIIDGKYPYVRITGKGNKPRSVPINEETVRHFRRYAKIYHPESDRSVYMFYTVRKGEKREMSPDNVARFLRQYSKSGQAECPEIPDNTHPHLFRKSRSMHMYQAGMPLEMLSQFLGHDDPLTTLVYARADNEMKRKAIEKVAAVTGAISPDAEETVWVDNEDMIKRLLGLS